MRAGAGKVSCTGRGSPPVRRAQSCTGRCGPPVHKAQSCMGRDGPPVCGAQSCTGRGAPQGSRGDAAHSRSRCTPGGEAGKVPPHLRAWPRPWPPPGDWPGAGGCDHGSASRSTSGDVRTPRGTPAFLARWLGRRACKDGPGVQVTGLSCAPEDRTWGRRRSIEGRRTSCRLWPWCACQGGRHVERRRGLASMWREGSVRAVVLPAAGIRSNRAKQKLVCGVLNP